MKVQTVRTVMSKASDAVNNTSGVTLTLVMGPNSSSLGKYMCITALDGVLLWPCGDGKCRM